jgi:hypothetical protein
LKAYEEILSPLLDVLLQSATNSGLDENFGEGETLGLLCLLKSEKKLDLRKGVNGGKGFC